MRKIFVVFLELLFLGLLATTVNAEMGPKLGQGQEKKMSIGKEKNMASEKTKEKKKTKGEKQEKKIEFSVSKSTEKTISKALSLKENQDFSVEISASDILIPVAIQLEKQGIAPFCACKLYSRPPTLKNVGIDFEVEPDVLDLTTKEYYENLARQQGLADVDYRALKHYVSCAFEYASILRCALLELQDIAEDMQGWLGLDDLQGLARKAVQLCISSSSLPSSSSLQNAIIFPCRWMGGLDHLRCGGGVVSFSPFSIRIGSLELFGHGKFAGLGGGWNVSSAFSLDRSFSEIIKKAENKSEAQSLARYVEKLESRGQLRKAALIKKKTIEQAKTGHVSLSLSPSP